MGKPESSRCEADNQYGCGTNTITTHQPTTSPPHFARSLPCSLAPPFPAVRNGDESSEGKREGGKSERSGRGVAPSFFRRCKVPSCRSASLWVGCVGRVVSRLEDVLREPPCWCSWVEQGGHRKEVHGITPSGYPMTSRRNSPHEHPSGPSYIPATNTNATRTCALATGWALISLGA